MQWPGTCPRKRFLIANQQFYSCFDSLFWVLLVSEYFPDLSGGQGHVPDTSRSLPGIFSKTFQELPGHLLDISWIFSGSILEISGKLPDNFPDISWKLPGKLPESDISRTCLGHFGFFPEFFQNPGQKTDQKSDQNLAKNETQNDGILILVRFVRTFLSPWALGGPWRV